jgi:hypothetical protein
MFGKEILKYHILYLDEKWNIPDFFSMHTFSKVRKVCVIEA